MAVVTIGSTFLAKASGPNGFCNAGAMSREIWQSGMDELEELVSGLTTSFDGILLLIKGRNSQLEKNPPTLRQKWVLQSCVLQLAYGFYFGDSTCFRRTRNFLAQVIDVRRARLPPCYKILTVPYRLLDKSVS